MIQQRRSRGKYMTMFKCDYFSTALKGSLWSTVTRDGAFFVMYEMFFSTTFYGSSVRCRGLIFCTKFFAVISFVAPIGMPHIRRACGIVATFNLLASLTPEKFLKPFVTSLHLLTEDSAKAADSDFKLCRVPFKLILFFEHVRRHLFVGNGNVISVAGGIDWV